MKFIQLFGVMAILVPHCLAASAGSKDLRDSDLTYDEQHALSQSKAFDKVIEGQTLMQFFCRNHGKKITHDIGNCRTGQSVGIQGAHNCRDGSYYYCVTDKQGNGQCITIKQARRVQMESGECFV